MNLLAARITGDMSLWAEVSHFVRALFDGHIDSVDCVAWSAILLGITCGILGSFIVLRRQSLLGDAIGHAVLPGVCLGFLAAGERNMAYLLGGAVVAGLLSAVLMSILQRTTRLKSGECMGAVFTGFYGLGIVLYKHILTSPHAGQSGLEKFLFGQIAGVSLTDVAYMSIVAAAAIALLVIFRRPLTVSSFDEQFAFGMGLSVRGVDNLLTILLTVAIVISIQAVGVVLVSAMLVTPAAAAYLLTDRLVSMVILSGIFGVVAGLAGAFFSVLASDAPTGAYMVLAASSVFALAFAFSPRYGVLPKLLRLWRKRRRTQAENLLTTMYRIIEQRGTDDRRFGVYDVAAVRQESPAFIRAVARWAMRRGWFERSSTDPMILTDAGLDEARRIVRNHRLWELFLTQEARLASDHVHADAEYIEHMLPKDVLRRLEQMLDQPTADPHGQQIPRDPAQEATA